MITKGQRVVLWADDRRVDALVILASPNGRSLMLSFEAILFGHVGMMPVFLDDGGVFRSVVTGDVVRIEPAVLQ